MKQFIKRLGIILFIILFIFSGIMWLGIKLFIAVLATFCVAVFLIVLAIGIIWYIIFWLFGSL